jgi:parallel beta-helix repeat protein
MIKGIGLNIEEKLNILTPKKKGKNMKKTGLILGFMLIMLFAMSTGLMADNQVVTSTANSGAGTLRQAIIDVGDGETITFNISGSDVVVISAELSLTTNGMTINGYNNATGNNVTVQVTIPGAGGTASRVFHINASGKTFNFSNMTIKGGDTSGAGDNWSAYGGGILFEAGTLNLDSVTISGAKAYNGGGMLNRNTSPTLTNCTISGNTATKYGGGIYNYGETGASSPTLTNCTINGNSAVTWGGGLFNHSTSGTCFPILTNCTISGNQGGGGGMYNYSSTPTLTNCTISGNDYRGIYHSNSSGLYIKNTILANNTGGDIYNSNSSITDNGYNIVESCYNFAFSVTGDITGELADLNLRSTLANNGTLNGTKTLALYYNESTASVAIDAGGDASTGSNNGVAIPTTDQRGAERYDFTLEANVQSSTDIGAYEDWPGGDDTLPVVLSTFTAQYLNSKPTLYWETQSETDNMGWFVYRNNENDFTASEKISEFIEGYGTTTQQQNYLYEDRIQESEVGDIYYYWLESVDYSGMVNHYDKVAILTIPDNGTSGSAVPVPERLGLFQNEPNPVINSTRIAFNLPETAQVDLAIYNLKGQLVKKLYSGNTSKHTVMWDGKDEDGKELENGVYFYKLIINGSTAETKKLILMK